MWRYGFVVVAETPPQALSPPNTVANAVANEQVVFLQVQVKVPGIETWYRTLKSLIYVAQEDKSLSFGPFLCFLREVLTSHSSQG